jgi:hypothetical protein
MRCRRKVTWSEIILAGGERTLYSSDLAAIEEDAVPSEPQPGAASPSFS